MTLKNNSFILSLTLLPFILLLCILRLINFLKGPFYLYLIIILCIIYIISFIISLFYALDEILNSNNKKRLVLIIFVPIIYLPFYYAKYVSSSEKYLSYSLLVFDIILFTIFGFTFSKSFINYYFEIEKNNIVLKNTFDYLDHTNTFSIKVDNQFTCDKTLEGYVLSCENRKDDSFIGIYSYEKEEFSEGELDDIRAFHLEDIIKIIEENGYEYSIEEDVITKVKYQDMMVLLECKLYEGKDRFYYLVIIKESPDYDDNINDFNKLVESIQFLK